MNKSWPTIFFIQEMTNVQGTWKLNIFPTTRYTTKNDSLFQLKQRQFYSVQIASFRKKNSEISLVQCTWTLLHFFNQIKSKRGLKYFKAYFHEQTRQLDPTESITFVKNGSIWFNKYIQEILNSKFMIII